MDQDRLDGSVRVPSWSRLLHLVGRHQRVWSFLADHHLWSRVSGSSNIHDRSELTADRFASLKVNYMTVPVYVLGAISLATQVYFSDKMRKRAVIIVACCVPVAIGYLMPVWSKNPDVGYAGMFVLVVGKSSANV